jgi:hypothetical protein
LAAGQERNTFSPCVSQFAAQTVVARIHFGAGAFETFASYLLCTHYLSSYGKTPAKRAAFAGEIIGQ